jgi:phosphopantetheinyl transferase
MPLVYQQNINEMTKIGVWHIIESESFFLQKVTASRSISHAKKRLQHLAGRYLLKEMDDAFSDLKIELNENNKPFIRDASHFFSISHCGDFVVAIINTTQNIGVDIEFPSDKILNIKHKFITETEANLIATVSELPSHQLTMIWCIKESVYKWYGEGMVDYRKHIIIETIQKNDNLIFGTCCFEKEGKQMLHFNGFLLNGHYIFWVWEV